MRILDINGNEISSPDLSLGYLVEEEILMAHHEAVEAVEAQWHYEVVKEYPNGGKDVHKVFDVEGVEAKEAWDEYEEIHRYILFTDEQLVEIEKAKNAPTDRDRIEALEAAVMMLCMPDISEV